MYNTAVANTTISTGIPAAVLAVSGSRHLGVALGLTLAAMGLANLLLLVRSGRQLDRAFEEV